jgi:hypothetical protein
MRVSSSSQISENWSWQTCYAQQKSDQIAYSKGAFTIPFMKKHLKEIALLLDYFFDRVNGIFVFDEKLDFRLTRQYG